MSVRFELLFSRAAPHSIDLKQLAAQSIDYYGAGAPRRRSLMERLAGLPEVKETARGSQTHVTRRAYYTHAELALSLKGLTGAPFLAAMYSMALDGERRSPLWAFLREAAAEIHREEGWPERVPKASGGGAHHYMDELCSLVLDEDWLKPIFAAAPQLYWIAVDVPEDVWRERLFGSYLQVRARYERWLGIARGHVHKRLFDELHREPPIADARAVV